MLKDNQLINQIKKNKSLIMIKIRQEEKKKNMLQFDNR